MTNCDQAKWAYFFGQFQGVLYLSYIIRRRLSSATSLSFEKTFLASYKKIRQRSQRRITYQNTNIVVLAFFMPDV
jgi:hypothetical protein